MSRKKPPPIESFRAYCARYRSQLRELAKIVSGDRGYAEDTGCWLSNRIGAMEAWLIKPDNKGADKKDWWAFIEKWLRKDMKQGLTPTILARPARRFPTQAQEAAYELGRQDRFRELRETKGIGEILRKVGFTNDDDRSRSGDEGQPGSGEVSEEDVDLFDGSPRPKAEHSD